ncbi:MAG: hypothetical protein JXX29_00750 [Deltaproteobacteria bacterium]|nr:hypothetical protein [Deltaproteobacteria bacterium]
MTKTDKTRTENRRYAVPLGKGLVMGVHIREFVLLGMIVVLAGCRAVSDELKIHDSNTAPDEAMISGEKTGSPKGTIHYLGNDRPSGMVKLSLKLTESGIEVLDRTEAPNSMNRRSPHEKRDTFFRVFSNTGQVLLERGFRLETEIRSESNGPDGVMEGLGVPLQEPAFSVSIPLFDNIEVVRFYRTLVGGSRDNATLIGEVRP